MSVQVISRRKPDLPLREVESPAEVEERLRRELARELHDRVAQSLTLMLLDLELFRRDQFGRQGVLSTISDLQQQTVLVINDLRQLIFDLRSDVSGRQNVIKAVRTQLAELEPRLKLQASTELVAEWPPYQPAHVAGHILRIVTEAVQNAARHGGARHVVVTFGRSERGALTVHIEDDGAGIEETAVPPTGLGLLGMRERALLLGGSLRIERSPRGGTVVALTLADATADHS